MNGDALRLDKWLWQARFFKSRSIAARYCAEGRLRVNGERVAKAHYLVRQGDVLTFPLGSHVRIVRIVELGRRRGPASEARTLYDDLDPPQPRRREDPACPAPPAGEREPGAGRPTKRERRALDRLRRSGDG
jgi:ribosome-associated heat shock protein Hsp15